MLIPWGRFARHLKLSQRLRAATVPRCHKDATPGGDLLLRVREVLCHRECLTLCGDLTGRPVSACSSTYSPDAVFGCMANRLRKGHQAVLVTLKGLLHRVHVAAFHHSGDTVSGVCLREIVEGAEARLGCRPRRRTDLLRQRIAAIEAKMAQKRHWSEAQQAVTRQQIERQITPIFSKVLSKGKHFVFPGEPGASTSPYRFPSRLPGNPGGARSSAPRRQMRAATYLDPGAPQ